MRSREQNNNFIIYEIGTFTYIIMNIYYDNLTRPSNYVSYNQITKFKKKKKKRKTDIQKSSMIIGQYLKPYNDRVTEQSLLDFETVYQDYLLKLKRD